MQFSAEFTRNAESLLVKSFGNHDASYRDLIARAIVSHDIQKTCTSLGVSTDDLVAPKDEVGDALICIIGAGIAGLYTALILDDLGVQYEILEASDRVGGRLLTHRFNGEVGYAAERDTPERYDYFDVGAMRFPDTPFMNRVFDLFRNRTDVGQLLVPYTLRDDNNLLYYNLQGPLSLGDYQRLFGDHDKDPDYFRVSVSNRGRVPDRFMDSPPNEWV